MDFKEKQTFAQNVFAELDILEAGNKSSEVAEEVTLGFGLDSE
jgi:hypothetical protein